MIDERKNQPEEAEEQAWDPQAAAAPSDEGLETPDDQARNAAAEHAADREDADEANRTVQQEMSAGDAMAIESVTSDEPPLGPPTPSPDELREETAEALEQAEETADEAHEAEPEAEEDEEFKKDWYILKVQSNRENSICDGLRRRLKIAGLEEYFGEIIVPTEEVREFKDGKARIVKRKLYPGYIVVQMAINDDTWFLVRETPGIGDFTGAGGKPTPMLPHEVERILRLAGKLERPEKTGPRPLIPYKVGDKVRIEEGNFQNFEGEVSAIDETNGRVTVMIQIFNRTTPVELEHWQVKSL